MKQPGRGRVFKLDLRDGEHLLKDVVPETRPKEKSWRCDLYVDQGNIGACVGASWRHFLSAMPVKQSKGGTFMDIYHGAQRHDEWPGDNYEGSTVRAGAEYLMDELKLVKSYKWAYSTDDVLNALGHLGPVVMGTDWHQSMFTPDKEGIIRVKGKSVGGHAYMIRRYTDKRGLAMIHNSWNRTWGVNGCAWIPYEDLETLLRASGEACMALE